MESFKNWGMELINGGFIESFCKVEFLCYQGDPNWLGWMVLGVFGLVVIALIIASESGRR